MTREQHRNLSGYCTSVEILSAIETLAGENFDPESDETACHAIWEAPTPEQFANVLAIAWADADPEETELKWGSETISR